MNWLRNRSTMTKLSLGFCALSLLMAGMGYTAISTMAGMNGNTEILYERHLKCLNAVDETATAVALCEREARITILAKSPEERKREAEHTRQYLRDVRTNMDVVERLLLTPESKHTAEEVRAYMPEWIDRMTRVIALAEEDRDDEALEILQSAVPASDKMVAAMAVLRENKFRISHRAFEATTSAYHAARLQFLVVIVSGIAGALYLGYLISRGITRPLEQTVLVLGAAAQGDLTQRAEVRSRDEIGQMGEALNTAIEHMRACRERDADYQGQITAIDKAQAVIEFKLDGTIVNANANFLRATGYSLPEIQGRHHSMFADPGYAASTEYREFWARLNRGEAQAGDFKRHGKGGKEVWLQASYSPILGLDGKPCKVVKYANDVTLTKALEHQAQENNVRQAREAEELRHKLTTIVATVDALAAGDFTREIPDLGNDGVGQMGAALNKAVISVRTALEGVREVSEQLADASGQLSAASDEISTGAQEQASSLEETASTLEEITATVRQNSDSAQQARQLASTSREIAERGGRVVGNAVEAMGEINHSSKKIADIITTIDEIAFQTNLLALNAAVEAARAGEQGRGFAVVASEVRNLAQRSATSAKEIKSLIEDSVKKVDAGTELVNQSGATLGEIVTSVKRVTDLITEIAAAGKEQSTGIEQVNKAVSQMDSITQRNASQTEEMSATAQTLTDQAAQLRDLVARFKLGSGELRAARSTSGTTPSTRPHQLSHGRSNGTNNKSRRRSMNEFTEF
ncbi:MCP four helix bundle domain-containing protein [Gemmata sp. G18]|uniref:MCP four helix bundle domain-containing protein n=1 Tax=Gemmata palustris TaxID=2822762 RepID=A0ABS5BNH9_9BACT|nr:methyl-accepting chemotaxis protein [Gemmata palustris]MBP3955017.1 MCP four helix bundle domain-containing protein [Gemmata palustris]